MRTMGVEGSRRPDDKSAGEIDMGGWIGVIPDAYDDAVTKKVPAGRSAKRIRALRRAVVIIERPGFYGLCRDIAHIRECGEPAQRHGIGDADEINMRWLEFHGLDGCSGSGDALADLVRCQVSEIIDGDHLVRVAKVFRGMQLKPAGDLAGGRKPEKSADGVLL